MAEKSGDELWLTPGYWYTHLGKPGVYVCCCRVIPLPVCQICQLSSKIRLYINSAWPQHSLSSSQSGFSAAHWLFLLCPIFNFDHWLRKSLIGNIILAVSVKVATSGVIFKGSTYTPTEVLVRWSNSARNLLPPMITDIHTDFMLSLGGENSGRVWTSFSSSPFFILHTTA